MFNKEYVFKGKHAKYVMELKEALFNTNADVLILAPVIGLVYNRKSSIDTSKEFSNITTKVFSDKMIAENEKILFNYRLCMLLSDEFDGEEKVDNAFRYYIEDDLEHKSIFERNIKLYNSYILGGVEVLYELMLNGNKEYNGNSQNLSYKKSVISNVSNFILDYLDQVEEMNKIDDDIDF